ncbi:MAG: carboxymuconolactone decarboxylase family protein [Porphyromonadaceae bacterium]|nr:carboxymuconolactone decarboxylase family protein [Porphyromonadaceae bacterium]
MTERINIHDLEPESYKAMMGLEKYLNQTGLSKSLKELIKIRASQISRQKSFLPIMKLHKSLWPLV